MLLPAQYDLVVQANQGMCLFMKHWASFIKLNTDGFICKMVHRIPYILQEIQY